MKKETAFKAITVRLKEKEFKELRSIAKKTGQSLSATVRNVIIYDIIRYAEKNNALRVLMKRNPSDIKKTRAKKRRSEEIF
jgi:hypothetical protein